MIKKCHISSERHLQVSAFFLETAPGLKSSRIRNWPRRPVDWDFCRLIRPSRRRILIGVRTITSFGSMTMLTVETSPSFPFWLLLLNFLKIYTCHSLRSRVAEYVADRRQHGYSVSWIQRRMRPTSDIHMCRCVCPSFEGSGSAPCPAILQGR